MKPRRVFFSMALALLVLSGCAGKMPRIIELTDPLTSREHLDLGVAYEARGEHALAIEQYELASNDDSLKPRAMLYTGNAYLAMGRMKEAERGYRGAIATDPAMEEAYNNLAWLLFTDDRDLEEAEGLALKAVELSGGGNPEFRDTLEKIRGEKQRRGYKKAPLR